MSNKRNNNDLGVVVIASMMKNGIATLPRNYELYYNAFSGNYPDLKKKMMLLGQNPSQADIDEIGDQFFPERLGASVVQKAGSRMGKQVESLQKEVSSQVENMNNFAAAVQNAGHAVDISPESAMSALTILLRSAGITTEDLLGRHERLDGHKAALDLANQEVSDWKKRAYTDELTQLRNRAAFNDAINNVYDKPDANKYSLILFDIDYFKKVNDTYGHPFGDRVLQLVAKVTMDNVRDAYIHRYGGEEFAIILKGVSPQNLDTICNRLRLAIEKMPFQSGARAFNGVTISLGSCMAADAQNANEMIARADEALYMSKNTGRNRYTQWTAAMFKPDQTTGGGLRMYR